MTTAKLAGVIGWPIAHSLSPTLHGHWLAALKLKGYFVPLAIRREDFSLALDGLRRAGFAGVNVTVPHKEAALAIAHKRDAAADSAGAANLLLFGEKGEIEARNTDIAGLTASLAEALGANGLGGARAVVLGAGGAARAALLSLASMGAHEIRMINRSAKRAEALAGELRGRMAAELKLVRWDDRGDAMKDASILINATSAGMKGQAGLELSLQALPREAVVMDLVYNPLETTLLKEARAKGMRAIDGLGMLMHQAVPAFEAFFGQRPSVTPELRRTLEEALAHG